MTEKPILRFSVEELALISQALVSYESVAPAIHSRAVSKLAARVLSIRSGKVRSPRPGQPVAVTLKDCPSYFTRERRHSVKKAAK